MAISSHGPRFDGTMPFMSELHRYRKKANSFVTAVRIDLDMEGFSYRKWGGEQACKRGDWLVDNDGDVYTIDAAVFGRTYREKSPGVYVKVTTVWAEVAEAAGVIETKEGTSEYVAGDYLVYNGEDRTDGYCMSAEKFASMYEAES